MPDGLLRSDIETGLWETRASLRSEGEKLEDDGEGNCMEQARARG